MQRNGNGSAATVNAAVPILVGGQRYRCPKCGNEPRNVQPGVPEALVTTVAGEKAAVLLCSHCADEWQVQQLREHVPALEPITQE